MFTKNSDLTYLRKFMHAKIMFRPFAKVYVRERVSSTCTMNALFSRYDLNHFRAESEKQKNLIFSKIFCGQWCLRLF